MVSCVGVSRVILVVLNFLLFIIGIAITAVGFLVLFSPATITDLDLTDLDTINEINLIINSTYVNIAAWVCVGIGVVIMIVSLCGCLGSAFTKTTLLGIYIFVILQIIVFQIGIGVVIYLSPDWFDSAVTDTFETHLDGNSPNISKAWDVLQLSVGCCGLNGSDSYSSIADIDERFNRSKTCCTVKDKSTATLTFLNGSSVSYENEATCKASFTNSSADPIDATINNIGCVDKIYSTIEMLAIILIALVAIEIFIFIISCVVCCNSRDEGKI